MAILVGTTGCRREEGKPPSLAEFESLLATTHPSEAEGKRFVQLIQEPVVRGWLKVKYLGMEDGKKRIILLAVLQLASQDTFREFEPIVVLSLNLKRRGIRLMAIKCLEYYDIENRGELLISMIRDHIEFSEREVSSLVHAYLVNFDGSPIEKELKELLDHDSALVRVRTASNIITYGNVDWKEDAFDTLNNALINGFASREPYETASLIRAFLASGTRPDKQTIDQVRKLTSAGVEELSAASSQAIAQWE